MYIIEFSTVNSIELMSIMEYNCVIFFIVAVHIVDYFDVLIYVMFGW